MTPDETRIQIFANWPMSQKKITKKITKKLQFPRKEQPSNERKGKFTLKN